MDKAYYLGLLDAGKPIFDSIPPIAAKRICGIESEYGVANKENGDADINPINLPRFQWNGGLIYQDCGHLEYATPECSNPLSATIYNEAGRVICRDGKYSPRLYCNNNDWLTENGTFGSHENYFTCAPRSEWYRLVPFLIARIIYSGNGWINKRGIFEISQRASFIECAQSKETQSRRAVVNMRPSESLSNVSGYDRLHLISGDATMNQVATFLRIATTCLAVEMLEKKALPSIRYNLDKAGVDMQMNSKRTSTWYLDGVIGHKRGAIELMDQYHRRAQELFLGRDLITDIALIIWADTLEKLAKNPSLLWRRIDWVAKKTLLDTFVAQTPNWNPEWLQSLDLEYHNLDTAVSLYYGLLDSNNAERLVSDHLIIKATIEPPHDTRAFTRGNVMRYFALQCNNQYSLHINSWKQLIVYATDNKKVNLQPSIDNPFKTYEQTFDEIKKEYY